jgi:hypothetical protein
MTEEFDPDDLDTEEETEFNDWEDETDDSEELDNYAAEIDEYVQATGTPVYEPGTAE